MNAHNLLIGLFAATTLSMMSCSEDSGPLQTVNLAEVDPERTAYMTGDEERTKANPGETYEFQVPIYLALGDFDGNGSQNSPEGITVIQGKANSYMFNSGSWLVELELAIDESTNTATGTYFCRFPDMGDEVTFSLRGYYDVKQPLPAGAENDKVRLDVDILEGTGRFKNTVFTGDLVLTDIARVIQTEFTQDPASIAVEGHLEDMR